ncbi:DNA repair protein RecO [Cloacibacterium sp. TD35]|uniref:DNA repair protein RecO n=1 Tax=Cloacibacterium sp. TD35 TaxID=2976818 RepID=UPI00237E9C64|nr:recombination protein O N-terminal domain-containing protein [Cloacibacterium sp. TD35]WDT66996.1 recombination protein O N-terminal domain-containing protein [Cloacibacterium sp. TD35]
MEKNTGFLLSYIKYGDHDAIINCYTLESGFQSFFMRGVYSVKNKKKAFLSPLNELEITFSTHHGNLPTIKKVELSEKLQDEVNVHQNAVIFFLADFLNQILKNESQQIPLYREIKFFKQKILEKKMHAHYFFLIRMLLFFGISPLISEEKFLNIEKGIFQEEISQKELGEELSSLWKKILDEELNEDFLVEKKYRKPLLDSILQYYKIHFPEFYSPKSLPVILEIFE